MQLNTHKKCTQLINLAQDMIATTANDENVMILMGGDFFYMNAYQNFNELLKVIEVCNKVQEVNMSFIMSTPSRFTDALKKEEVTWPVFEHDLFPYQEIKEKSFWTGFYSSRPALKKQVKDASAFFNAEQNVFARLLIDQSISRKDVNKINQASF